MDEERWEITWTNAHGAKSRGTTSKIVRGDEKDVENECHILTRTRGAVSFAIRRLA